ncbi:hypothetical protein A2715_04580 [Candidatus Woesebacteria bacterium RIFCSPHIGHO2_01_FULL_39_32]|uniref:TrpR like protein, YerC/YecD n=1 Tax=Candidatus Woesebacteria bacterium RIFCSPLOWO2_01_FULL_39_25 TaxID=1802521 RepID=A0A1F8BL80_9BACT|nr:MAG: hypothetical protein A2124_02635 [Candidatus Woesebacteria bacterium GWB1_37_5]OGM25293.1 MAG: hypothetical protein A2715_04580 [Candidatus Woesebacteria bacterium RIFCSPHIGHO2_01_FULL_39_32]OGM37792.1 MAG: hypothetical protein A3F01_01790 [Candidatus Woesebacteria bacterium RIFCSPHIGHO2_12_FULL_38_11]OGM64824.1 MAG: hypothetical protein A2893_04190 [Candidatus Woesebacteria bacterium RIFCSPLOWO2_01_FULL_39_25]
MTKISRIPLRTDVWERIFDLFIETLADLKDKQKFAAFVDDFFSPTEKIMFAKRLALTVLLAKSHDYQSIRQILRISPPTIAKMSLKVKYEGKGLHPVIEGIFKKEAARIIWKEIESLFDIPTKGSLRSPESFKRRISREQKIAQLKSEF